MKKVDLGSSFEKFIDSIGSGTSREDYKNDIKVMNDPENMPKLGESKTEWFERVKVKFSPSGRKQLEFINSL